LRGVTPACRNHQTAISPSGRLDTRKKTKLKAAPDKHSAPPALATSKVPSLRHQIERRSLTASLAFHSFKGRPRQAAICVIPAEVGGLAGRLTHSFSAYSAGWRISAKNRTETRGRFGNRRLDSFPPMFFNGKHLRLLFPAACPDLSAKSENSFVNCDAFALFWHSYQKSLFL